MKPAIYLPRLLAVVFGLVLLAGAALAGSSYVVVFGDSLSDSGNTFAAVGYPGSPYYLGRHTNGPVTPEYVAQKLGAQLKNFAYDGATTGVGNVLDKGDTAHLGDPAVLNDLPFNHAPLPGMSTAFETALGSGQIPIGSSALYMIWGGANDFRELAAKGGAAVIGTGVTNEMTIAGTLAALGASNIYVLGLPDLSLTPKFRNADAATLAGLRMATLAYNAALQAHLPPGVRYYDTNALFTDMYNNYGKYGLTDARNMCYNEAANAICGNPDQYLFWDDYHPTAAVNRIVADSFVAYATPEPAVFYLVGTALLLLGSRKIVRR